MSSTSILITLTIFLTSLAASHWHTIQTFPRNQMDKVIERVGRSGERLNTLVHAPPVSTASRNVVRPSPDLIYSICVYDLSNGPVYLEMTLNDYYSSLSIFDNDTNNFFVINDRETDGASSRVILYDNDINISGVEPNTLRVESPTRKGVALIRRLAGSPEMLAAAQSTRLNDSCRPA